MSSNRAGAQRGIRDLTPAGWGTGVRWITVAVLSILSLCLVECTTDLAAGTTTETTNGVVAGLALFDEETPAVGITVRLRSTTFLPEGGAGPVGNTGPKYDLTTDSAGVFSIDSIEAGTYILEMNSGDSLANSYTIVIDRNNPTVDLGKSILESAGSIRGVVIGEDGFPLTAFVKAYGYEHLAGTDSDGSFLLAGMPAGVVSLSVAAPDSRITATRIDRVSIRSAQTTVLDTVSLLLDFDPFSLWPLKKRVIINTTATGAGLAGGTPETDFPLLVRLNNANFDFDRCACADGRDIRFSSSKGKRLPHVVQSWPPAGDRSASAEALLWVQVDTIVPDNALQFMLLHYGYTGADDPTEDPAVFDSADGYVGVWHFDSLAAMGRAEDASGNGNGLTPVDTQSLQSVAEGIVGSSRRFTTDWFSFLSVDDNPSLRMERMTFSAWIRYEQVLMSFPFSIIAMKQDWDRNAGYSFGNFTMDSTMLGLRLLHGADTLARMEVTASVDAHTGWMHVAATYDGAYARLYMNGNETSSKYVGAIAVNHNSASFEVGHSLNGDLDELWVCNTGKSPSWIRLLYETQRPGQKTVSIVDSR